MFRGISRRKERELAYEFTPLESIGEGVARCAREELDGAIQALGEDIQEDPVDAVHTARKAIKKERALLRLARAALPSERRAQDNARLRDVARTLSEVRDADVMVQTVENLAGRFTGQLPAATFTAVRDGLRESGASQRARADIGKLAQSAASELAELRLEAGEWDLEGDGWNVIQSGLKVTYRRGRKALRKAHHDPSDEQLHAWRKRVKDHWYHLRLLTTVCGPIVGGAAQEADRLADVLGEDHDLGVLRERLVEAAADPGAANAQSLLPLIDHRREQRQGEAWQVGRRLYAEKPRTFERRLHRLWKAGQIARNLRTEVS